MTVINRGCIFIAQYNAKGKLTSILQDRFHSPLLLSPQCRRLLVSEQGLGRGKKLSKGVGVRLRKEYWRAREGWGGGGGMAVNLLDYEHEQIPLICEHTENACTEG